MERLGSSGCVVGDYIGGGHGNSEDSTDDAASVATDMEVDAQPVLDLAGCQNDGDRVPVGDHNEDKTPVYIFYDCESTGLSIYNEHLTEVAAEAVFIDCPPHLNQPTYSSLVRTTRRIPAAGGQHSQIVKLTWSLHLLVTQTTGITTALLRSERPLSAVLPEFLQWIHMVTKEVEDEKGCPHFPGNQLCRF